MNHPKTDPFVLGAVLPRWAELGHGPEVVALLTRLVAEPYAFRPCTSRVAQHLDNRSLEGALEICEAIGDDTRRIRCLAELAAMAPDDLANNLISLPLEDIFDHQGLYKLSRRLPQRVRIQLHEALASPLYRLATAVAADEWLGALTMADLAGTVEHVQKKLEEIDPLNLSEWGRHYRDLTAATDYFVKALEMGPAEVERDIIKFGREIGQAFGVDAPRACVAFCSTEEVIHAAKRENNEALSPLRLCGLAAALKGWARAEVEAKLKKVLQRAGPGKVFDDLTNAPELTPALLDLAFETSKLCTGDFGLSGADLVEHLAKAGRIADALVIMARIPSSYDNVVLKGKVALATYAEAPAALAYLDEAWGMIFRDEYWSRKGNDSEHIRILMPCVLEQPQNAMETLLHRALPVLSRQKRSDMFDYLAALAPLIHALGGREAIVEVWRAAEDVARWWP